MTKEREPLLIDLEGIWRLMVKHQCADAPKAALVAKEVRDIYEAERKRLNDGWWNDRAKLLELVRQTAKEMERYRFLVEWVEKDPVLWHHLTQGTGIATANGYRHAIARCKEVVPDLLIKNEDVLGAHLRLSDQLGDAAQSSGPGQSGVPSSAIATDPVSPAPNVPIANEPKRTRKKMCRQWPNCTCIMQGEIVNGFCGGLPT